MRNAYRKNIKNKVTTFFFLILLLFLLLFFFTYWALESNEFDG